MSERKGYVPPDYLEKVGNLIMPFKQRTYELMQLQNGQRVLDVGCGTGIDTVRIAKIVGSGGAVVGVDFDAAMITQADERAQKAGVSSWVKHQQGDATVLPFETGSFDACRCERVYQHLLDPDAVLAEMMRVTKPGGWLVVMDPDWGTLSINSAETDLERRLVSYGAEHNHHNGFSGRRLVGMFRQHGLADVAVESGTFQMEDAQVARFVVELDKIEANALSSGFFTAEEMARWRSSLEQAMADGSFFAVMTGITIAGRKH